MTASQGHYSSFLDLDGQGSHSDAHHSTYLICFVAWAIALGISTRVLLRGKEIVPYSVVIYGYGLILGFLQIIDPERRVYYGADISKVPGDLILMLFLPVLIFETGFFLDLHLLKGIQWHALVLAVPGVIISTFGMGFCFRMVMDYSWPVSLLNGAILAPTDPVAVIAILKSAGASKSVSALVEGESLFNDGLALVLFKSMNELVIKPALMHDSEWILMKLYMMPWVILGGPMFGWAMGRTMAYFIKGTFSDAVVEVSATICGAYLAYYLADISLGTSGVLSLVCYSLVMNYRRSSISPEVENFLKGSWHFIVFVAETMIFLIQGIDTIQNIEANQYQINASSFLNIPLLFLGMNAIRFLMVFLFYPLFKCLGKMNLRVCFLLAFGGLRGAISLALAMEARDSGTGSVNEGDLKTSTMDVGFLVFLSIIVNGLLSKKVVNMLKLSDVPQHRKLAVECALRHYDRVMDRKVQLSKMDPILADCPWKDVVTHCRSLVHYPFDEFSRDLTPYEQLEMSRVQCAQAFQRNIHEIYSQGRGRNATIRYLNALGKQALDGNETLDVLAMEMVRDYMDPDKPTPSSVMTRLGMWLGMEGYRKLNIIGAYDIGFHFRSAQQQVLDRLPTFCVGQKGFETMKRVTESSIRAVDNQLKRIGVAYPGVVAVIKSWNISRIILNKNRTAIQDLIRSGRLEEQDGGKIIEKIEQSMQAVKRAKFSMPQSPHATLRDMRWFQSLDPEHQQVVLKCPVNHLPQGASLTERDDLDGLVVLVGGILCIEDSHQDVEYLGPQRLFNVLPAMTGSSISSGPISPNSLLKPMARAKTSVHYIHITQSMLQPMLSEPTFKTHTILEDVLRLTANILKDFLPYAMEDKIQLQERVERGYFLNFHNISLVRNSSPDRQRRVWSPTKSGPKSGPKPGLRRGSGFSSSPSWEPPAEFISDDAAPSAILLPTYEYVLIYGTATYEGKKVDGPTLVHLPDCEYHKTGIEHSGNQFVAKFSKDAWVVAVPRTINDDNEILEEPMYDPTALPLRQSWQSTYVYVDDDGEPNDVVPIPGVGSPLLNFPS